MSKPDDSVLDEAIRRSLSGPVPPAVERTLRARLAGFRERLKDGATDRAAPALDRARGPLWGLVATLAAAVLLAVTLSLTLRPRTSFAESAAAVLQQPWVHVRSARGQDEGEAWFSPTKDIRAVRAPERLRYEDHRLQVYYTYDPREKVVYRGPLVRRSPAGDYGTMATAMKILLQQGRPPDRPPANLGFLGPEGDQIKVLDQTVSKVTEDGHAWLDYRLKVRDPESAQPITMWFRVDPLTRLPHFFRIDGTQEGKPASVEARFDYPEKGPVDIYDLGAPRTARFVDRIPSGDIKRILETIRAGRERMGDYRAFYVERTDVLGYPWWRWYPQIIYRKGNKFRRDWVVVQTGNAAEPRRPAEGEDLGKWCRERSTHSSYFPMCVVKGTTRYNTNIKPVRDPDGTEHRQIESVSRSESHDDPGETSPPWWFLWPEFACRPRMGIGDPHVEPVIDLHPTEGPPGCIVLTLRDTSSQGRVNEKGIVIPDGDRYWLDPNRDYMMIRHDWFMRDPNGRQDVVEETARSPQGVWYATRIRRHFPRQEGEPKMADQIYYFYVDFNVDLPDSLFDPPKPGRIY